MLRPSTRTDDHGADPGETLPVGIGAQSELEDDSRKAGHRSVEVQAEELVVQGREQERCGFAADAGNRSRTPVIMPARAAR